MTLQIGSYGKEGIEEIGKGGFLSPEDLRAVQTMQEELQDTFEKRQLWRTETEMRVSVLNDQKFPTPASKYWQAVREQAVFFEELVTLGFEYRRNEIKIRKLEKQIANMGEGDERDELQVDLDEALFGRINMQRAAADRTRELKLWSTIKSELDDGSFDASNVDTHQLISYGQRFLKQLATAMELNNLSLPEMNNLKGQLLTTLRVAKERGVAEQIVAIIPEEERAGFLGRAGLLL